MSSLWPSLLSVGPGVYSREQALAGLERAQISCVSLPHSSENRCITGIFFPRDPRDQTGRRGAVEPVGGCWPVSVSVCLCGVQMEPGRGVCSSASWQEAGVPVRGCRDPWTYISKFNHLQGSLSPTLFSAPDLGDQVNPQALPRTASDLTALLPLPLGGWTQSLRGSLPSVPQNPKSRAPLASGIRKYVLVCASEDA